VLPPEYEAVDVEAIRQGLLSVAVVLLLLIGGWLATAILLGLTARLGESVNQSRNNVGAISNPAPTARGGGLASVPEVITSERDGAEMVFIPPGEFIMGTNGGYANEKPEHTIFVDGFYIYKYEVTVAQYKSFLQDQQGNGHEPDGSYDSYMPGDYFTNAKYANHPVVNVNWEDAAAYCRWAGNRLPREAEWEKAARGTGGKTYPWGDAWDEKLSNWDDGEQGFRSDGFRFTAPVGSFPKGASPFGIHDMAGNVWEWVDDWYQPYRGNSMQDPDFGNTYRVIRGGSWLRYPLGLTATSRDTCAPKLRYNSIGFRCACDRR
jgi:formylglycine-generating enzyme required for sulfatase activity